MSTTTCMDALQLALDTLPDNYSLCLQTENGKYRATIGDSQRTWHELRSTRSLAVLAVLCNFLRSANEATR